MTTEAQPEKAFPMTKIAKLAGYVFGGLLLALGGAAAHSARGEHEQQQPTISISSPVLPQPRMSEVVPASAADVERVTKALDSLAETTRAGFLGMEKRVSSLEQSVIDDRDRRKEERRAELQREIEREKTERHGR